MLKTISFPYGHRTVRLTVNEKHLNAVLRSKIHDFSPAAPEVELVREALKNPIDSPCLSELSRGKNKVVIIASDHTRPVPSKVIIPPMLEEIRAGNPHAEITILISTGCHRETTREELVRKFGEDIVERERIVIHDCDDTANLVDIGRLPSGGRCIINRLAYEADLLVSEGFIEPHFFAGFSGGRKSVLSGIAARRTVLANHCSEFINSKYARTGNLENNPIHADMLWAAKQAGLAFIVNVVINSKKEVIYAVAGNTETAHLTGCRFLSGLCRVEPVFSDIVITSNGGYPLDQNIYQAVKGMTAAEATVNEGGVIIMLAESEDGHGGEDFYHQLADEPDILKTEAEFLSRGREETVPDQWQSQIFIRILKRARVIYISDAPDDMVRAMHMIPAHSIEEALDMARRIIGKPDAKITAIPDGVSVIVG
ncbi:MAG: nickel-dependent lactate racemase [Clostridiales bacterium]|nr:nickel-dependent lactate racemase [Clostridiales bacterium]